MKSSNKVIYTEAASYVTLARVNESNLLLTAPKHSSILNDTKVAAIPSSIHDATATATAAATLLTTADSNGKQLRTSIKDGTSDILTTVWNNIIVRESVAAAIPLDLVHELRVVVCCRI